MRTRLVCFDTAVIDLSEALNDPVEVLFGVQIGGGTDINQAVAYCEQRIEAPAKTHLVLITDLFEGGDAEQLVARIAALGIPVFGCTPDRFPDLMAAALRREDIQQWASGNDIKTVGV